MIRRTSSSGNNSLIRAHSSGIATPRSLSRKSGSSPFIAFNGSSRSSSFLSIPSPAASPSMFRAASRSPAPRMSVTPRSPMSMSISPDASSSASMSAPSSAASSSSSASSPADLYIPYAPAPIDANSCPARVYSPIHERKDDSFRRSQRALCKMAGADFAQFKLFREHFFKEGSYETPSVRFRTLANQKTVVISRREDAKSAKTVLAAEPAMERLEIDIESGNVYQPMWATHPPAFLLARLRWAMNCTKLQFANVLSALKTLPKVPPEELRYFSMCSTKEEEKTRKRKKPEKSKPGRVVCSEAKREA